MARIKQEGCDEKCLKSAKASTTLAPNEGCGGPKNQLDGSWRGRASGTAQVLALALFAVRE